MRAFGQFVYFYLKNNYYFGKILVKSNGRFFVKKLTIVQFAQCQIVQNKIVFVQFYSTHFAQR